MNTTYLNAFHHAEGGNMVNFAGWEMPINYGSQINEHNLVRQEVGVFDVSHMAVFDLKGDNQISFLEKLLPNNINKIKSLKKALYSPLLNYKGGILDDLIVYHLGDSNFRLVSNCATREQNKKWFNEIASEFNVEVDFKSDYSIIALQGPSSKAILDKLIQTDIKNFEVYTDSNLMIAGTGYTGEKGFEIISDKTKGEEIWHEIINHGVKPIGLAARDTLRLEAGFNLYGSDMTEKNHPYDSNLSWTVDLKSKDRDFIGRDALQTKTDSSNILCGFYTNERGVLRSGAKISYEGGSGTITSGTWSPTFKKNIGLCRIGRKHPKEGRAFLRDKEINLFFCETNFLKYLK